MKPKRAQSPKRYLTGKKAVVIVERCGAMIRVDDVPATEAGVVLADMLETFRVLAKHYPELVVDLGAINGGTPVDVDDGDADLESHRVGFR